jgi:hypothetical protein
MKRLRRPRYRWSLKVTLGALLFFGFTPATRADAACSFIERAEATARRADGLTLKEK